MKIERKPGLKALALALSLTALLLPVSCSKDTTEETESPGETLSGDLPIRFRAAFGEEEGVKGMIPMTTASLDSFGVFAAYIPENGDPDKLNLGYMINVPYGWDESKRWYDSRPPRYWPVAGTMTFFALTPYDEHILDGVDMQAIEQSKYPTIPWGPDPDPKKQVDICVAVNKNVPRQMEVPLEFHHATSQIYFAANYVELEPYQFIVIDSISFTNIIGAKHVTIKAEPPYVEWEKDAGLPRTMGYRLTKADGHLKDERLLQSTEAQRGVDITADDGRLYLVPQSYDAGSTEIEFKVGYTLYYENTDIHGPIDTVNHFVMEAAMPPCKWEPDTRYRYVLSIHDVTQEISPITIALYEDRRAVYYPMVCSFLIPSMTKSVGVQDTLRVQVGPEEVTPVNMEIDWSVNGVSMQRMYDHFVRGRVDPEADSLRVYLEFRDAGGNPLNPDPAAGEVTELNTHLVWYVCRKITAAGSPAFIKARTRWAATEDTHKEAQVEIAVEGRGVSFSPYPTGDVSW